MTAASVRPERRKGPASAARQTWQVSLRYLRALLRQPAFVVITLVQPLIWLLLFGALFKAVTQIPGFASGSYLDYLTPGIVVMLAVSSAGWTGMAFIEDINRGVMDRLLVTPAWRGAFNLGSVAQCVLSVVIQTLIIVVLAWILGAHVEHVGVLIVVAALLAAAFASFSNGLGVLARQRESLIGAVSLLLLPLTFLSGALMQLSLAPGWIQNVAKFNPVDWAAVAARSSETGVVLGRVGLLAALVVVASWFATRAFAVYQRSL
ncbi:MAG TPA: ABC transporter permease [Solirubrobacter sp.]|nr:ABC transporter permease [Solirubrobacter sp.]